MTGLDTSITDAEIDAAANAIYKELCAQGRFGFPTAEYGAPGHEQLWIDLRHTALAALTMARRTANGWMHNRE